MALVSGGSRGLGPRLVRMLAQQGMRVVLGCRSVESGRIAIDLLGDLQSQVAVRQLDITDTSSIDHLAGWLSRRLGRCDVLMNNVAVHIDNDRKSRVIDLELVRRGLTASLLGTWRLTQAVAPLMRVRGYGRIVNVPSGLCNLASTRRGLPAYRVSKFAVGSLTRRLALELAADNILVNACCPDPLRPEPAPGPADTPVWLATLPDDGPTGGFYQERVPLG